MTIKQYLISKGANIEAKDKDGLTSLHFASISGHLPIVECLISKGENIELKDKDGWTPYDLAKNNEIRNILK